MNMYVACVLYLKFKGTEIGDNFCNFNNKYCFKNISHIFIRRNKVKHNEINFYSCTEDEIILIEHLPGRRVHLQDFFWTGLEDAPSWVDPNQGLTFYETKTIVHTVTVYTPSDEKGPSDPISPHRPDTYNPECITCIEPTPRLDDDDDQSIGVLIGDDPGPR